MNKMVEIGRQSSLADLLAQTKFAVEASRFEQRALWTEYHKTLSWRESLCSFGVCVGTVLGLPVMISVSFERIEGHIVMFYEDTSQVVDHRMIEAWVSEKVPAKWDSGSRKANTDATNFHLCMHALKELNAPTKQSVQVA